MRNIFFSLGLISSFFLFSCNSGNVQKDEQGKNSAMETKTADTLKSEEVKDSLKNDSLHHAQNALNWEGKYKGVLPCADCEGIETIISLYTNKTFKATFKYLGKGKLSGYSSSGKMSWLNDNTIALADASGSVTKYFVGENQLIQLDFDGKRIQGDLSNMFILTKIAQ